MTPATQVALVEDDTGMRQRIARVVDADPLLSLAFSASNATDILAWLNENPVDVLLVDLGLPDRPGLQVISQCRTMQPACAVMVLSIFGDEANMVQAFEAGASGYLLKDGTETELATHIRHLRAGGSPMSPVIARQLLRRWQARAGTAAPAKPAASSPFGGGSIRPERLSPREFEVLDLVSRGFTYVEVGTQMGVSASTVQTHIRNIYGKLDVHNKSEAVFEARNLGWLP
ncbi:MULTISPECIES: response regulator transcription factor [Variovorax]|mgnify:CR=1 FL=1|jgi:DNA-binding NarL/FixJ family response regulator|uniref:response regulator transcription factor n=1 Tax=Variovorax TaxID=34072 RepID=UPI00086CAE4E|nr:MULTISPECIES: response regulator transcription factor [Variovorax]MBN8754847.1 response regulator transcription factor [Variovorax sp.]ODU11763.1 MAG: DNA-binding response regulator [Variovorax sp. SCN 67-85]ODV14874.1 MAG: DNA-binding response regulator [Variovorax sp. SCN 67-20]OJZ05408.1 MAG: DNA-binding response regulator [Variovorax sp. 67-131]UKI05145.1 response regulator transcription factor [Variovorax paradoxus]